MGECAWREDEGVWGADCGHEFVINDGTPEENDMKFCCFCGKRIVQFPQEEG
jgi:hypothetical protein